MRQVKAKVVFKFIIFLMIIFFSKSFSKTTLRESAYTNSKNKSFGIELAGDYAYSKIDGFIQIPSGGNPTTSSIKRPTFSELNINHDHLWDLHLGILWQQWDIFANYQQQRIRGNSTMQKPLITHGVFVPTDTDFYANTKFDLYEVGLAYTLLYHKNHFKISPLVNLTALKFNYQFRTSKTWPGRHFLQVTPRAGLDIQYDINSKLRLELLGISSIPQFKNLDVYTARARIFYLLVTHESLKTQLYTGIEYQKIKFKDHQVFVNYIELNNSPMVIIGLQFTL